MDPNGTTKPPFPEQKGRRPISDVPPSFRDPRVIACYRQVFLSQFRPSDLNLIIEVNGNHQAIDKMIAVLPHAHDAQAKIDLGRRENLHILPRNIGHGRLPAGKNARFDTAPSRKVSADG
jgi:hypothetical protein